MREALDATTREKNLLKQQLSQERAHSHTDTGLTDSCSDDELRFQLSEQQDILSKTERERDALRERLSDIETHRQVSMEQYQQEVETSVMEVTNQVRYVCLFVSVMISLSVSPVRRASTVESAITI